MPTTYTSRTRPSTSRTGRPKSTIWIDYFRYSDQSDIQTLYDNNWNRMTFISSSWFEEIDNKTQWTPRISI